MFERTFGLMQQQQCAHQRNTAPRAEHMRHVAVSAPPDTTGPSGDGAVFALPCCWQLLLLLFLTSELASLLQTRSSLITCLLHKASASPSSSQLGSRQHVLATAAAASTQTAGVSSSSSRAKGTARTSAAKTAAVADKTALVSSGRTGGKSLMIVESPTKATKIQKFLGDEYKVCQVM